MSYRAKGLVAAAGVAALAVSGWVAAGTASAAPQTDAAQPALRADIGRAVLPGGDGWAAFDGGTTGGRVAAAADERVVTNRSELVAALGGDNTTNGTNARPKIIYVKGRIDGNVDDANRPLSCADYAVGTGYTREAYLAAYDPATWGSTTVPTGPLEDARAAAALKQNARVVLPVGSNTTIVGVGADATLVGINLMLRGVDNVIVRNLTLRDASDCFPQWDPTDTSTGNWNSDYDLITVAASTHIWVDHNTFTDEPSLDSAAPKYFGRPFDQHDGATDIIRGSDFVTLSWNRYEEHHKAVLVGNSSNSTVDPGKLRITMHHNLFKDIVSRTPALRYGRADVYNNWFVQSPVESRPVTAKAYSSSFQVGVQSHLWAQANFFTIPGTIPARKIIAYSNGTVLRTADNLVNGQPVDLLAAYNAAATPARQLAEDTTWTPLLRAAQVSPAKKVPALVGAGAGAGRVKGSRLEKADRKVRPGPKVLRVDPAATPDATTFTTVQAAIDAVPADNPTPVTVLIAAGRYREVLRVPAVKPFVTLRGATGNPRDVVLTYDNGASSLKPDGTTYGTTGSASMTVLAPNTTLADLTVENAYDEVNNPKGSTQAVALKTQADRIVLDRVRALGNQDTLYTHATKGTAARVYLVDSYVTGDVDFVFGAATLVVDRTVLNALPRVSATTGAVIGGIMMAPATEPANRGFLLDDSYVMSDAPAGSYVVGRPWHPGNDPTVVPEAVVRNTALAAAVGTPAWADMSGFSWRDARFAEYRNAGPGAVGKAVDGRAQLSAEQAATARPRPWLAGTDGWNPTKD